MKVTVRSSAAGLAYGLFLNYLDPRAFSGMEPASIINADVMLSRSMPSKAPIVLDLYNIFSVCTSGRWRSTLLRQAVSIDVFVESMCCAFKNC